MTKTQSKFTPTAVSVLKKRYLLKDDKGELLETPDELFARVACAIGNTPEEQEQFYGLMDSLDFLPNSPTLMNAGTQLGQLSGCFVLPIEDSIESIFSAVKAAALVNKSGGGTGFAFSRIRPMNDTVLSTHGVASGPLTFMRIFDTACDVIKQGGKRRGANMGILRVDHPDILEFIQAKTDRTLLTNFNLSVGITHAFMKAVQDDTSYPLVNPRTGEKVKELRAVEVLNLIVDMSHENGEPGIIFIDTINDSNPLASQPGYGPIEATNPCGEQPLYPYESCNLGSINLSRFVKDGAVDYERLEEVTDLAARFLDNVVDHNVYPLPEIREQTLKTRKIGLGVMGFADMLVKLGIPYASRRAVNLAKKIMSTINNQAQKTSFHLAESKGACRASLEGPFKFKYRNIARTTIAPTGTLSIIAGCSSGIEPVFAWAYQRTIMDQETFNEVHPVLTEVVAPHMTKARFEKFVAKVVENDGVISKEILRSFALDQTFDAAIFDTSYLVPPAAHLRIQAAFQEHTDNAVSKTINLPAEATAKDVKQAYLMAYQLGLKGVTVYRDGSRDSQVLSATGPVDKKTPKPVSPQREQTLIGPTTCLPNGCGKMYVTLNYKGDDPFEVFIQTGKQGGCEGAQNETTGRLMSLALRYGVPITEIVEQMRGIRCPSPTWVNGKQILSCADCIAQALQIMSGSDTVFEVSRRAASCPDCGTTMEYKEGCNLCPACGYSKCGGK